MIGNKRGEAAAQSAAAVAACVACALPRAVIVSCGLEVDLNFQAKQSCSPTSHQPVRNSAVRSKATTNLPTASGWI